MASITSDKFPSLAELINLLFTTVKTKILNALINDTLKPRNF